MKKLSGSLLFLFLILITYTISCNKDQDDQFQSPHVQNKPPVADAGTDITIYLPTDSVMLDGSNSKDEDGNIQSYQWSQYSGPSMSTIMNPTISKTLVKNLVEGLYIFQLTILDNKQTTARDFVQVLVINSAPPPCSNLNRPEISTNLTEIGNLSVARTPAIGAAGSKIVFAGGYISAVVDIYDINTHVWTTAQLSQARDGITVIANGNKIFFAGGSCDCYEDITYDNVDIYDVSSNTWTVAHLSAPRTQMAAAAVGNKVIFAGGTPNWWQPSSVVDIYDLSANTWSTAALSVPRMSLAGVTVGEKVYFGGGENLAHEFNVVDIYDNTTGIWSQKTLTALSGPLSATSYGEKIYWSGLNWFANISQTEIWNTATNEVSVSCLSFPRMQPATVTSNNNVLYFGWDLQNEMSNRFDIYNTLNQNWSVGILNQAPYGSNVISVNNVIYLAGGSNGANSSSGKVFTLSW